MAAEQETIPEFQPSSEARRPAAGPVPAPLWLQRLSLVVLVLFCFYIGGALVWLPWFSRVWNQNGWLIGHPAVYVLAEQGWLRGLVSGLGLIDIWIGVSELLHYRDFRS